MPDARETYRRLIVSLREISTLDSAGSLLSWDEKTFMPKKGAELRAMQASLIARMVHEKFVSPEIGGMLGELESSSLVKDRESDEAVNVHWTRRNYDRATKGPAKLVEGMSGAAGLAHEARGEARKKWIDQEIERG